MNLSGKFQQALQDYIFLLNKKYPDKSILEMVSTRYSLKHFERSMLYRGITTKEKAERRKNKLIIVSTSDPETLKLWNPETLEQWNFGTLHIDLFNILFTIAAYLRGLPVYISNDGIVRDASESHDCSDWKVHLFKGLEILLQCLNGLKFVKINFYLDNPLTQCQTIAEIIKDSRELFHAEIDIIRHDSPDHLIRNASDGIIATSDSTIIDKSALPVFDLARHLIEHRFEKKLQRINDEQ